MARWGDRKTEDEEMARLGDREIRRKGGSSWMDGMNSRVSDWIGIG